MLQRGLLIAAVLGPGILNPACAAKHEDLSTLNVRSHEGHDHRHGPGCGHHWDGRYWVVVRKDRYDDDVHIHRAHEPPRKVIKVHDHHDSRCGCAWDHRKRVWIVVGEKHVHGPGCGHAYIEGRWTIRF